MEVNWLAIIAVLGTIGTFVGIVLTIFYARRSDRRRLLVHDLGPPLALASVLPDRTGHRLSIVFEREGSDPENVKGAYLRFLRLGNLGKEPIRSSDFAPADPLRIRVSNARLLDLAISSVSREVINFGLGPSLEKGLRSFEADVSFDFLDYEDGAVVRILVDTTRAKVQLLGSIVGMPQGILPIDAVGQHKTLNYLGCALWALLQIAATAGALLLFRNATGGWDLLWILLLPFGALFLPAIIVLIVYALLWPKGARWPKALSTPRWFNSAQAIARRAYPYSAHDVELMARGIPLDELEDSEQSARDDGG